MARNPQRRLPSQLRIARELAFEASRTRAELPAMRKITSGCRCAPCVHTSPYVAKARALSRRLHRRHHRAVRGRPVAGRLRSQRRRLGHRRVSDVSIGRGLSAEDLALAPRIAAAYMSRARSRRGGISRGKRLSAPAAASRLQWRMGREVLKSAKSTSATRSSSRPDRGPPAMIAGQ